MFKLGKSDSFTYPVKIEIPGENGRPRVETFDGLFRRASREEFQAKMEAAKTGDLDDLALAREVLIGWRGVQDEDGAELEFNATNCELLLNVWPVCPAVVQAWLDAHSPKGRAKN